MPAFDTLPWRDPDARRRAKSKTKTPTIANATPPSMTFVRIGNESSGECGFFGVIEIDVDTDGDNNFDDDADGDKDIESPGF